MDVLRTRAPILSLIKIVSEEQEINNHTIIDVEINQKGEGYLGEIFMVTVKDAITGKQLEMVIKAAFIDDKIREMAPIRMSFQNEIYFYTKVHPLYIEFEKEREVENVEYLPKCFQVSTKENEEMLALENLKSCGFEIFDKKLFFDDDHVRLIFKTYGKFHGYSFALRDQKREKYAKLTNGSFNVFGELMKKEFFRKHLMEISKTVQNTFISGEDDEIINKYKEYLDEKIVNIFKDIVTQEMEHVVILHGDCWSNNMMFKYEKTSDGRKPIDIRLIDWQMIRVGSPICDLSSCLYSGAPKEILDNLNEYLEIYYNSFSSFVKELGSDPEKLFPFSVLKEHWKKYAKLGMIMSVAILKKKLTIKEDLVDLTDGLNMEEIVEAFANVRFNEDDYNERIRRLLWHMSEIDAL